jgi:DNA repair protein RecN (Recombination protein N)
MLVELHVTDFAIIDEVDVRLNAGFNVITGETGAGKSILVDAVDLLLGGRADSVMVRAGAEMAVVEGVFETSPETQALFAPIMAEIADDPTLDRIVLRREVRATGRSSARINDALTNLDVLRGVGELLVDIHGQSAHLSLLRTREQLAMLDRYAGLEAQQAEVAAKVKRLIAVRDELESLLGDESLLERRLDTLQFQLDEIDGADVQPGEDDALRSERDRLANAEKLAVAASEIEQLLYEGSPEQAAVVDLMDQAARALGRIVKIDEALSAQMEIAEDLSVRASELARTMRRYREDLEFEPARLREIDARLDVLGRLKRKYGGTLEDVVTYREQAQAELDSILHRGERAEELRVVEESLLHEIGGLAAALSESRREVAARLAEQVESELADLSMEGTRFAVGIEQQIDPAGVYVGGERLAFDATGIDRVTFLMAANPGEPMRPLAKVASGGEMARLMLAIKTVLAHADRTPTLIFDEIDQGVGGRMGMIVGEKLWGLAHNHQVLVVTHLPQLAGFGDAHWRVQKALHDGRTVTEITRLAGDPRVEELAAMLGSQSDVTRRSAQEILEQVGGIKAAQEI